MHNICIYDLQYVILAHPEVQICDASTNQYNTDDYSYVEGKVFLISQFSPMRHIVTLRVKRGNLSQGTSVNSIYFTTPPKTDQIEYRSSLIRIICDRSRSIDGSVVLTNNSNTIFRQIMKVILYYGAVNLHNSFIHRLEISSGADKKVIAEYSYKRDTQPIPWHNISFTHSFNTVGLANQLFVGPYGDKLANILSHWLVGVSTKDRHKKFESLWRTFEQLCDHHNRAMANRKEFDNLREMRAFMEGHAAVLPLTSSLLSSKDYAWLRRFQWRQLIYNNYPLTATKRSVWEGYRDHFVMRNTDSRIITMLNDTLVYRKKKWVLFPDIKTSIDSHIATYTANPVIDDVQLAALLCCKFAYFIRNKIFHGEVYEKNFRFYNTVDDDWQVDELNAILETLSYELIDNYAQL